MRSARVALTTLRRLDKVKASLFDEQGAPRHGVLRVPSILPVDDWERVAVASQEALLAFCISDAGVPAHTQPDLPDPHIRREGIDYHRPDPNRTQENAGTI